jgi:hypothetical protein
MSKYTPVFVFRCQTCGGENVMVHEGNPEEKTYACEHHGVGDREDGDFDHHGIGKLKDHYRFEGFYIVKSSSAPKTLEDEFSKEEADILDLDEHPTYSDYFECVLKGRERSELAEERGVALGTVTANIRHAREMLSPDDGGEDD